MDLFFVLEGHEPKSVDAPEWGKWFAENDHYVAFTAVGNVQISTIFTGLNTGIGLERPRLFETMVFGGVLDHAERRYTTWDEAIVGHNELVRQVEEGK